MPLRLLLVAALALSLGACVTTERRPEPRPDPLAQQAARLFEEGRYDAAAEDYLQLARTGTPQQAAIYRLLAADSLLHAGREDKAREALEGVTSRTLPAALRPRYRMVAAALALAEGRPEGALTLLDPLRAPADRASARRVLKLRAKAYEALGEPMRQALTLIRLDPLLDDEQARLQVQLQLLELLTSLPEGQVRQALQGSRVEQGWRELAALVRGYPHDPQGAAAPWREWQALFPGHPALPQLLVVWYRQHPAATPARVHQVAVFLPSQGPYARAAEAIRNGLTAAWYADADEARPELRFYDSSDPEQLWPQLHEAQADGADLAVGPLAKAAVRQLARAGGLPLPVLALNRVETDATPPQTLFQFGLAPEDEAEQAARHAAGRGFTRPGLIYPDTALGERLKRAFEAEWHRLGGGEVRMRAYHRDQNDYSDAVAEVLDMKRQKAEHKAREQAAGHKLPFEPELPVDFLFIAGNKTDLLQLRPLVRFHHGTRLPVYGLSRVWKGELSRDEAFDLGGLLVPEIPWLLGPSDPDDPLSRQTMAELFPHLFKKYPRLLAMGMDAYTLLSRLAELSRGPDHSVEGKTGELRLDEQRHVKRRLTWVRLGRTPKVLGPTPPVESVQGSLYESLAPAAR